MAAFEQFADDFHNHFTQDPNERILVGVDRDLGELPDPSLSVNNNRVSQARHLLERAAALTHAAKHAADQESGDAQSPSLADPLSWDQHLDMELATLMLSSEIHVRELELNGSPQIMQLPRAGDDVGDGLFLLMANDPRPASERLADILGRLEAIPEYLDKLIDRTQQPVQRWVDIDKEKIEALPGLLDATVSFARENNGSQVSDIEAASKRGKAAMTRYLERLDALETTTAIHLDEADARKLVKLRGIELSFEQQRDMARDFLAETRDTLSQLQSRLIPKYGLASDTSLADLHTFLNTRFAVKGVDSNAPDATVLKRYSEERARILRFIEKRDLFPILANQEMKILATPSFLTPSIPAGAMMPPPPFRTGTRTSLVYLTIRAGQLDDHTDLGIPSMMIHEGIPGHHLQLATAATHTSIIRRHINAAEQAEGWTTMLEDYMLDLGYMGEFTDEARFCGKRDLSRIGARVVIDLFLMTGERSFLDVGVSCDIGASDPFVAAGNLLAEVTGFNPGRVEGELNWYSQERGYPLCYLTGNKLVWKLKEDAATGPSGKSGLELDRHFHKSYLEAGNMPLSFLRQVMVRDGLLAETGTTQ